MQTSNRPKIHQPFSPLENRFVIVAAYLLLITPLWIAHFPPMIDLPQHAAQASSMKLLLQGEGTYTQLYEINLFTPYLVGYMLVYFCSLLVPTLTAQKLVLSLALIAVPELTGILLKTVGANPVLKWLVFPSLVSLSFYWGFSNFLVATPISIGFLILVAKYARTTSWKKGLAVTLFSVFLFFCHIVVLGFMSLIAISMVVGFNLRNPKRIVLKCLPFTAPIPLIVYWLLVTFNLEAQSHGPITFGPWLLRISCLLGQLSGSDHPLLVFLLSAVLILFPLLVQGELTSKTARWLPFCVALAAFSVFPLDLFGTGILYPRFAALVVLFWGLMWDAEKASKSRWQWLLVVAIALWLSTSIHRAYRFRQESAPFQEIVTAMEPGKRVLSLVDDPSSNVYGGPVYTHFPVWYQVERNGIVDFNFALFFPQIVRYKQQETPPVSFGFNPRDLDWKAHRAFDYDYFVVRSPKDISSELFRSDKSKVALKLRSGSWWLYEQVTEGD